MFSGSIILYKFSQPINLPTFKCILIVPDLLENILLFIDIKQLAKIATTCSAFSNIIKDEEFIIKTNRLEKSLNYSQNRMQLFFRGVLGQNDTFEALPESSVADLTTRYANTHRCKKSTLRFMFSSVQLKDGKSLQEYGITTEATIHVIGRLNGD